MIKNVNFPNFLLPTNSKCILLHNKKSFYINKASSYFPLVLVRPKTIRNFMRFCHFCYYCISFMSSRPERMMTATNRRDHRSCKPIIFNLLCFSPERNVLKAFMTAWGMGVMFIDTVKFSAALLITPHVPAAEDVGFIN